MEKAVAQAKKEVTVSWQTLKAEQQKQTLEEKITAVTPSKTSEHLAEPKDNKTPDMVERDPEHCFMECMCG